MFSTHLRDDIYLAFTEISKFSFYLILFRRFTVNQLTISCFKPNHNNSKEDIEDLTRVIMNFILNLLNDPLASLIDLI